MLNYPLSVSRICSKSIFIAFLITFIFAGNAFPVEVTNQYGSFSAINSGNQGITLSYTLNSPLDFSAANITMADPVYSETIPVPTFSSIGAAILIGIFFFMGIFFLNGKGRILFLSISLLLLVGLGDTLAGRFHLNGEWWEILKQDRNPGNSGTHSTSLLNPGEYSFMLVALPKFGGTTLLGPITVTVSGTSKWSVGSELNRGGIYFGIWEMSDGKLLTMGRTPSADLLVGQIYDPATATWASIINHATQKTWNNACKISGKDKIIFPVDSTTLTDSTTLIYDYSTGSWSQTGSFRNPRYSAELTCLSNGKVLLTGGSTSAGAIPSNDAEIYNPNTGQWAIAALMNKKRIYHKSVVLSDGKVLVIGGSENLSGQVDPVAEYTAEVYDPAADTWTSTNPLSGGRMDTEAVLLSNGKVLASGGYLIHYGYIGTSEIYDPATNSWSTTGSMSERKNNFATVLMADGKVMAAGGLYQEEEHTQQASVWSTTIHLASRLNTAEIYNPGSGAWSQTYQIRYRSNLSPGILLSDGRIMLSGGWDGADTYYTSTEIYTP